ncbi:hypothetical protein NDU88_011002 [Pleurodeles waltl]|uniref:UPAR/Ly6 domain-containing protein n=1 Tax=Pleurodeles waltl TaxID=8319 RepID=A0AAV7PZM8_PLEWA|nr:hypothetical protein NDU88_011002 [Pleurodeles waltl]
MRVFLAVLLAAVLAKVNPLQCETCSALGSATCFGPIEKCAPDVTLCVKGLETNIIGKVSSQNAFKRCLDPIKHKVCTRELSFRNSQFAITLAANCCSTDKCNGESLPVTAPIDIIPNGYKCGECTSEQSASGCTATQDVLCTGTHYYCGSFNGTGTRPGEPLKSYSYKGCISKDACSTGLPNIGGTKAHTYQLTCTPANRVASRSVRV